MVPDHPAATNVPVSTDYFFLTQIKLLWYLYSLRFFSHRLFGTSYKPGTGFLHIQTAAQGESIRSLKLFIHIKSAPDGNLKKIENLIQYTIFFGISENLVWEQQVVSQHFIPYKEFLCPFPRAVPGLW